MKRKYICPEQRIIDLLAESMISTSFSLSDEHADEDFEELSNEKRSNFWGNDGIWK